MAQGQLPLYYKNSKLVGPAKTKWSEYYLLVVTLFGFLMLFGGVLWFLPSIEENDSYTKAYGGFTGTEPSGSSGTESMMSPLDKKGSNLSPTLHPSASNLNGTGNHSILGQPQVKQSTFKSNPNSVEPVDNVSPQDPNAASVNTMRRNKVVQVNHCAISIGNCAFCISNSNGDVVMCMGVIDHGDKGGRLMCTVSVDGEACLGWLCQVCLGA